MALSASTVLEVRIGGSDTNGGGFVTGSSGTDWSLQTSPKYTGTDGVATSASTTFTSASSTWGADIVGNLIYITGGTLPLTAAWYQVTARASNTSITLDRAPPGAGSTGCTFNVGGALLSPAVGCAILAANANDGLTMYIKYNVTAFSITTASYNVAGGCCQPPNNRVYIVGYDTTRALYSPFQNRPTIQLNVASGTIFQNLNAQYSLQGLILDANLQTSSTCAKTSGEYFFVKGMNGTLGGLAQNSNGCIATLCEVTGCTGGTALSATLAWMCKVNGNTGGFGIVCTSAAVDCISYGNTGFGFALAPGGTPNNCINCVSYNNTSDGFYLGNTSNGIECCINCVSELNGGFGYKVNTGLGQIINCADYNNTSGRKNTASLFTADLNPVTGSGSFFVNAAGGNFNLNNTAGAGASARAISFPGATGFPGLATTVPYRDLGAAQHQDAGGSSGPLAQLKTFGRGSPY